MATTTEPDPLSFVPTEEPRSIEDIARLNRAAEDSARAALGLQGQHLPARYWQPISDWYKRCHTVLIRRRDRVDEGLAPEVTRRRKPILAKPEEVAGGTMKCEGACGQVLPINKFPTVKGGSREKVCRADRDARLAERRAARKAHG